MRVRYQYIKGNMTNLTDDSMGKNLKIIWLTPIRPK
jgi:hypothetical protein